MNWEIICHVSIGAIAGGGVYALFEWIKKERLNRRRRREWDE